MKKDMQKSKDQFLTLKEAAKFVGKSVHNVSYLITYGKINKYNSAGKVVKKGIKGLVFVSKNELEQYTKSWQKQLAQRRKSLNIKDQTLAFSQLSERERTKHIHRLHPYMGKFIPQLVEYYLKKNFTKKDIILDPFMGSGTTLAVSSELGLRSVGIEISPFNCMISNAKLQDYDIVKVSKEIEEIYNQTKKFSDSWTDSTPVGDSSISKSEYLNKWFAKRTLAELAFYKKKIPDYQHQDILKIILTRAARSSRLVHHYDIATPTKPVTKPYKCRKHFTATPGSKKIHRMCHPLDRAIGKIKLYTFDTTKRIETFSKLRKSSDYLVLQGDSRFINLTKEVGARWKNASINGIFTSPPYLGQIDYHGQHQYAYELLKIPTEIENEIGRKKLGKGKQAQEEYQKGISAVFANVSKALHKDAKIFIVANDKANLYEKIIKDAGMKQISFKERPVEARAQGDKTPYSEKIFECALEN